MDEDGPARRGASRGAGRTAWRLRRGLATFTRTIIAVTAGCLIVGGDLTYRVHAARAESPAAATLRSGGPQPSNTAVRWLIQSQYRTDGALRGARLSVHADNGTVTLSGLVPDEQVRERAVRMARGVRGVSAVDDRLRVDRRPRTAE